MKKTISILFSVFTLCGAQGQSLKHQGTSVEELVPQGWSHYETTGDLNKDGIADVAVMSRPNFKDNMDCMNNFSFEVTNRGVLNITIQPECTQGSYFSNISRYSYRFQNGNFFLIGKEIESIQRNTGEVELVSENYLTWKRQVKKSNFSEDTPPIEKWTRLSKRPLEKLGEHLLGNE